MELMQLLLKILILRAKRVPVIFIIILATASFSAASTEKWPNAINDPYKKFRVLNTQNGLSANRITDIIQDNYFYVWIATTNGINRFDGSRIKKYGTNEKNTAAFSFGTVSCISQDNSGNIWAGSEKGLLKLNRNTDTFEKKKLQLNGFNELYIRAMLHENDSLLWLDSKEGLLVLYNKNKEAVVETYQHPEIWQHYYLYHALYQDKAGVIWLGGRGIHPMFLDPETKKIRSLPVGNEPGQKPRADVSAYLEDKNGNFWITGNDGIFLFNRDSLTFSRKLRVTTFSVTETNSGELWLGTGSGIYIYDPDKKSLVHISADINNPYSLPSDHVNCIYEDPTGTIWAGTDEGVAIFRNSSRLIRALYHIPGNTKTIASDQITALSIYNNNLWIGHKQHGIDILNFENGSIENIKTTVAKKNLKSDKIRCFYEDSKGDMYIGLWEGIGFARKLKETESFELFTKQKKSREIDWYNDFTEDNSGNFYVGFWGGDGLQLFDRKKGTFKESLKNRLQMPFESRLITRLYKDTDGLIWIGTTNAGIHVYNPENGSAKHLYKLEGTTFENQVINDFFEDEYNRIWVAADSLYCFDPKFEKWSVWGKDKGLASSKVYQIVPDLSGNLWLGTDKGILCFNPLWNFSISFPDLSVYEMNEEMNAGLLAENGELIFGSKKGLCIFNPGQILSASKLPEIFISGVNIKGIPVAFNPEGFNSLQLKHDENFFGVEFSNSDLSATDAYAFRYRLNPLEDNWTYSGKGSNTARYTNIPSGNYILEIQLAHDSGNWEQIKSLSLEVNIDKPFWNKNWFYFLISITFLALMYFIIKEVLHRQFIHRKNSELKENLLRAQINPHFIFNALVAIQGFVYKNENIEAGKYLGEFSKLIRLTLENTRKEYISLTKEIEFLEYYLKLQQLRYSGKFDFQIEVDDNIETDLIEIPPMLTQPFIENSIEHGLAEKEGKGNINIKIVAENDFLEISISDNGIGRKLSQIKRTSAFRHKSYGTEITQERLDFLRKKYSYDASYKIDDLSDDSGKPSGTLVYFKIPIISKPLS